MKICVLYFSRTGNTKYIAEKISESLNAKVLDINSCNISELEQFDLLIVGTPVEGFRPSKEIIAFVKKIPFVENKKAIVFCTYALWKARSLKSLGKNLKNKGYDIIGSVSKRGAVPNKTDYSEIISEIYDLIRK
jgi:flavodoxin